MFRIIIRILRNKYSFALFASAVWIIFFDKNDLISQVGLRMKLRQMYEDKAYYIKEIGNINATMKELKNSPAALEKFAREKYLMKRENEDVFVIVYKD